MNIYFWGKVQRGRSRGKSLGFPTANICLHKSIPEGIYLSRTKSQHTWYPSLTFIGKAITFGETKYQSETYLLTISHSLYNEWVTIKLIKKIRDNKKFDTAEELVKQMKQDEIQAKKYFSL